MKSRFYNSNLHKTLFEFHQEIFCVKFATSAQVKEICLLSLYFNSSYCTSKKNLAVDELFKQVHNKMCNNPT